MALYKVSRTDDVMPGEFVEAVVIAGGTAQARKMVGHLSGVTAKNVQAVRMDTAKSIELVSVYWDERTTDSAADAFADFTF